MKFQLRARGAYPSPLAYACAPSAENKKGVCKFSARFLAFSATFLAFSTVQKIVLSWSRGQGNFRRLEASRPRPRTSKCVLEDSTSGRHARVRFLVFKTEELLALFYAFDGLINAYYLVPFVLY